MKYEREEYLCRKLEECDFLSTEEVAALLGSSPATARRIINRLAENRTVRRVHGGVRRIPPESNQSIPFRLREQWFSREKRALAAKAMELIRPDSVIFVHGGSTTGGLGFHISGGSVITNSLHLAELLRERFPGEEGPEVIIPGGTLDRKAGILSGTRTEKAISLYHADAVFFSARGLDSEGALDTNDETAGVARAMIDHARLAVMLADHSKFTKGGMVRMVFWGQIDVLITGEYEENKALLKEIARQGVRVITVPI